MTGGTVVVMAKECVPGRVKTRLHPPFGLDQAARIAQAALDDTLAAVSQVDARRVLCVQGEVREVAGFEQIAQVDGDLDERIAAVLDAIDTPVLLIGMDTPQVDPVLLQRALDSWAPDTDAWFGPATDGGFWLLGLRSARDLPAAARGNRGDLVRGIPMSRDDTGARQRARLVGAGLRVADLPALTDIDDHDSLRNVATALPQNSAVTRVLAELSDSPAAAGHAASGHAASAPKTSETERDRRAS